MKRSLSRLVVRSVLVCWAVSFAVIVGYASSQGWTRERAQRAGIFLVRDMLAELPPSAREARLRELRPPRSRLPRPLLPRPPSGPRLHVGPLG